METVLLTSGTVGQVAKEEAVVGKKVVVKLHDENGLPIFEEGMIEEIL